jgi:hypothetical protein
MKLATLSALAMLLGASSAMAGGGAPVPPIPESSPPSGRPGEILDDAKCEAIWNMTERDDDGFLRSEKAAPFVTNFHAVDANADHKISQEEFTVGCQNGWIEEGSGSPLTTKKISPDVPKE